MDTDSGKTKTFVFSASPVRRFSSIVVKTKRIAAFSMAELIVVITILAILATVGFLALSGYREDAKNAVVKANVRTVYSAIMAESSAVQKSARCFIRHDPAYSLTGGAMVVFDGSLADTLV